MFGTCKTLAKPYKALSLASASFFASSETLGLCMALFDHNISKYSSHTQHRN
jgi:hypothetical protein